MKWLAAFIALISLVAMGCTDPQPAEDIGVHPEPDAAMETLRTEQMVTYSPPGLTDEKTVDVPADGDVNRMNAISRSFVAPSDEALTAACNDAYQAAIGDGWSGDAPGDATASGVIGTVLEKDEMSLRITCRTTASFDLRADDDDVIGLFLWLETDALDGTEG